MPRSQRRSSVNLLILRSAASRTPALTESVSAAAKTVRKWVRQATFARRVKLATGRCSCAWLRRDHGELCQPKNAFL